MRRCLVIIVILVAGLSAAEASDSLHLAITAGTRDGETIEGGFLTHDGAAMNAGSADPEDMGIVLIFTGVTVAQSTVLDSLPLWGYCRLTNASNTNVIIRAEDTSSAANLSDATDFYARGFTSASITRTYGSWTTGTWVYLGDFAAVVNEVLARGDWSSGNAICIWVNNNGTTGLNRKRLEQIDNGTGNVVAGTMHWNGTTTISASGKRRRM